MSFDSFETIAATALQMQMHAFDQCVIVTHCFLSWKKLFENMSSINYFNETGSEILKEKESLTVSEQRENFYFYEY